MSRQQSEGRIIRTLSATERMERARKRTHAVRQETMAFVAFLTRMYPAHRCQAERKQSDVDGEYDIVVCVHTPEGQMAWKLTDEESERFSRLPMRANDWDRHTQAQRIERIDALTPTIT